MEIDSELPVRDRWTSQNQFFLACFGYAVGLGNIWRFPYLVYKNGGGCFLVPFFLMAIVIGMPIFFCELFVGQYSGFGPIIVYRCLSPLFRGLGFCVVLVIIFVTIYYMVIMSWIVFYFMASLESSLKWSRCTNSFNSDKCYSGFEDGNCKTKHPLNTTIFWNKKCTVLQEICREYNLDAVNQTFCINIKNETLIPLRSLVKRVLASEEYYHHRVLGLRTGWTNFGWPRWELVLCLFCAWIIAFFCSLKSFRNSKYSRYLTSTVPFIILTVLLVRGFSLEGAIEGLKFYLKPNWSKLLEISVWCDAASQIFYSFGLACGSLISFAASNKFRNNFHRDLMYLSIVNLFVCIYAGLLIFSMLGFLSNSIGVPVDEVVESGPGLAFIAYPEAVMLLPLPRLWSLLFFLMMFSLGMGSQFSGIDTICHLLTDKWPLLKNYQIKVLAIVCVSCFLAGLPMACNGGAYLLALVEWHTVSWAILILGLLEVVILSWIYGMDNVISDLIHMGINLPSFCVFYWRYLMVLCMPVASLICFVLIIIDTIKRNKFRGHIFPTGADLLGWGIGLFTLIPLVGFAIYVVIRNGWSFKEILTPTMYWQPKPSRSVSTALSIQ